MIEHIKTGHKLFIDRKNASLFLTCQNNVNWFSTARFWKNKETNTTESILVLVPLIGLVNLNNID